MGLDIVRGEGIYLYSRRGKAYMDMISGIGVSSLGHSHPQVVRAVQTQAARYMHAMVYGELVLSPQVQLAKALTDRLPRTLDAVYFVNSGAEAVEGAMKLAKKYTGRYELVACTNAYHGSTHGAAALMRPATYNRGYHPLMPGVRHMRFGAEADLALIDERTAAVIIEPVQGEAGVRTASRRYWKALRRRCRQVGALLILDEIQTGYGRTGHLFAFQGLGITPDILLTAKAMGGGMPLGAFIAPRRIMRVLSSNPILGHITTFGGHPVSAAAGLAALRVLTRSKLMDRVKEKEALFRELLEDHPAVVEIRSAGLMMAVELASAAKVRDVVSRCLDEGVIIDWFLFNDKSFRLAPPLVITKAEIRRSSRIIRRALDG